MKHTVRNVGRDAHGTAIPKADFDMVLPRRFTIVPVAARDLGGQFHGQNTGGASESKPLPRSSRRHW